MKAGRKKKQKQKRLVKELREEIEILLTAMQVFTRTMGVTEAPMHTQGIVHGFLRVQVREMNRRLQDGEDERVVYREFLSGLGLPEITSCMLTCSCREGEGIVVRPEAAGQEENPYRKGVWKKGICAVMAAAVVIVMGVGVIAASQGQAEQKENRLRHALSQALVATVGEMPGVHETNQLLAGFMQHMLQQVDDDIDLTVKICDMDVQEQTLEVEAVGEYESIPGGRRSIRVRRRLRF